MDKGENLISELILGTSLFLYLVDLSKFLDAFLHVPPHQADHSLHK